MDIIDVIVEKLVKKYGADSKEFAYDEDKFLRLFIAEYNVIINKSLAGYDMITNPEYLTNNIPVNNIEGLKKAIDKRRTSCIIVMVWQPHYKKYRRFFKWMEIMR